MIEAIGWLRSALDAHEQWARAASRTYPYARAGSRPPAGGVHWRWAVGDDWSTAVFEPALDEFVTEPGYPCWLLTVEEWPTSGGSARPMSLSYANTIIEMDAAAAGHIVRNDPAHVIGVVAGHREQVDEVECWHAKVAAGEDYPGLADRFEVAMSMLRPLLRMYRAHPGFRNEWLEGV